MKLNKNYSLTSDPQNWILTYEGEPYEVEKNGEIKIFTPRDTFYYPTISSALKSFLDKSLKNVDGVSEILLKIKEVQTIIETIKKLK